MSVKLGEASNRAILSQCSLPEEKWGKVSLFRKSECLSYLSICSIVTVTIEKMFTCYIGKPTTYFVYWTPFLPNTSDLLDSIITLVAPAPLAATICTIFDSFSKKPRGPGSPHFLSGSPCILFAVKIMLKLSLHSLEMKTQWPQEQEVIEMWFPFIPQGIDQCILCGCFSHTSQFSDTSWVLQFNSICIIST